MDFSIVSFAILNSSLPMRISSMHLISAEKRSAAFTKISSSRSDSDEGFNRLIDALFCIDEACERVEEYRPKLITKLPQKVYEPYETDFDDEDVAREDFFIYPPGIPVIAPGEIICKDTVRIIETAVKNNMNSVILFLSYTPYKI